VESGPGDLKLYDKIKLDGAAPLTAGEATYIIDLLGQCDVLNVELEGGDQAVVTMRVFNGTVTHRLRLPTIDEVLTMRKEAAKMLDLPYDMQDMRIAILPAAKLWDICGGTSEDYAGAIPAIHKDAAFRATVQFTEREVSSPHDETNF
jgi:hypothetical protein